MDLYHSWLYVHVFNTTWFVWGIVILVGVINFLAPVILWFLFNGKPMPFIGQKNKRDQNDQQSDNSNETKQEVS